MTVLTRGERAGFTRLLTVVLLGIAAFTPQLAAQTQQAGGGPQVKVGILPFADATASGNRAIGADIGRTLQAEMAHSTSLMPRLLTLEGAAKADDLDGEKAVAIGREHGVDLVFMGTVLEARTEESNKRGWLPSIKGQSASVDIRRIKATVTLQGDLYDVATGGRIFSVRVTGNDSNNAFGGTAYTTLGSWGNDSYRAFLDSPLGKALQAALVDMTKKVAAGGIRK